LPQNFLGQLFACVHWTYITAYQSLHLTSAALYISGINADIPAGLLWDVPRQLARRQLIVSTICLSILICRDKAVDDEEADS
jgi:hypothetical protein